MSAPAQVKVIAELPESRVEASQGVEDLISDEHSRCVDPQDVAAVVVLALVRLASRGTSDAGAGPGDLLPNFEQAGRVVPGGELGPGDTHRR